MLSALVEDLSKISDTNVVTTWDSRSGPNPIGDGRVIVMDESWGMFVDNIYRYVNRRPSTSVIDWFARLTARCDATLVIAPEFDDILGTLCQRVESTGKTLLGATSAAVRQSADKLKLAGRFESATIHSIPTHPLSWNDASQLSASKHVLHFPLVVKPRDGAGSQHTYLVRSWSEFEWLRAALGTYDRPRVFIWQPFVAGRAVSVALLIPETGGDVEIFPVAEQLLSDDGRFHYKGGRIPARDVDHASIRAAAMAACNCVPGLRGYVGVDLIVPDDEQLRPVVVEINPRLTTSYLGYRALAMDNLAERMLPNRTRGRIEWRSGEVEFDASGNVKTLP